MSTFALGVHTFGTVWDYDAASAIEALAGHGFTLFELLALPPQLDVGPAAAPAIAATRRAAERCGARILGIGLAVGDYNLASTDAEAVSFALKKHFSTIDAAAELGAERVTVVPGRRHALLPPPDGRLVDILRRSTDALAQAASDRGLRLGFENHPLSLLPTAAALAGFIAEAGYDNADVIYDAANAFSIGEDFAAGLAALGDLLGHVHLSDSPKGGWKHDPIGAGDIDFAAVNAALVANGRDVPVLLEIIARDALGEIVRGRDRLTALGWRWR